MGLCQSQLPGKPSIVNGASRRRAGTTVITRDQDHPRTGFRHTSCHGADARLRHQFHRYPRIPVGVFQVIDQLCQIFDGINIMMRRWRNQGYSWCGVSRLCHPGIYFFPWQMSALSRLCALCHLDLDLLGTDQVSGGHAKASRSHLLNGRTAV